MKITYSIDNNDIITDAAGSWNDFAQANDAPELTTENIIGRSLWDFMHDLTTREVYSRIIARARTGNAARFEFRCDASRAKRRLRMSVTGLPDDHVSFSTELLEEVHRTDQRLLDRDQARSNEVLFMCAWCARLRIAGNEMEEIETAVERLGLFKMAELPRLSHGICSECYERVLSRQAISSAS